MKKLLILTTLGIVVAAAGGCKMCDWLFRGSAVTAQPAPAVYCDPCATAPACDPCAPACGPTGAMVVSPTPEYLPAPR